MILNAGAGYKIVTAAVWLMTILAAVEEAAAAAATTSHSDPEVSLSWGDSTRPGPNWARVMCLPPPLLGTGAAGGLGDLPRLLHRSLGSCRKAANLCRKLLGAQSQRPLQPSPDRAAQTGSPAGSEPL